MDLLLIDDEVSLRRTMRSTLESMGHAVAEDVLNRDAAVERSHREHILRVVRLDGVIVHHAGRSGRQVQI